MAEGPFGSNPMPLSYLNGGNSATAESMNELFGELDAKLAKTFGGGKSFILAANELAWMERDHSLMRLLGVPFFFHSGSNCKYINPIARMVNIPNGRGTSNPDYPYIDDFPAYDEQVFINAQNNSFPVSTSDPDYEAFDSEKNTVKIVRTSLPYWKDIGYEDGSNNGYRKSVSNLFDRSLLIYKFNDGDANLNDLYLPSFASGTTSLIPSASISTVISGDPNTLYNIPLFLQGVSEGKDYLYGSVVNGSLYQGGEPAAGPANIWRLDISAPSGHYFLNKGLAGAYSFLNANLTIQASGNSLMTLSYDSVDGSQINPPNPHWARISKIPTSANAQGFYLQELQTINGDDIFCQPERNNQYALADILVENRPSIELPSSGNKYDCYRVHNFNQTQLEVDIGTGFSYSMSPFECRTFRKFSNNYWNTGFHYFFPYHSGDPRYYTVVPLGTDQNYEIFSTTSPSGFYSWDSIYNSYAANNLLNPSILFDWIEAFSTETNPVSEQRYLTSDHGRKALLYQDINNTPYDVSLRYSGFYDYPISDDTIIGDLIHHKGQIKIAKVYKGILDANGNSKTEFDWVNFSGYSTIVSDFASKNIDVTYSNGTYILSNPDTANIYLNLIPVSTNLLKQGEFISSIINIDTPYELERCVLDSSYYQDSWPSHVSGQNVLFQTEQTYEISGGYRTGDSSILSIIPHLTTVGEIKNGYGLTYSGITGLSIFTGFDFTLTPNGLYLDFQEKIPAYYQLVPQDVYSSATELSPPLDNNQNPINWFGEIKSFRNTAIPWTRLQGEWDLDSELLTRKRRLHFRGHGFGWSNLKFSDISFDPTETLSDLASFNTLYTSAVHGRHYLRPGSSSPISGLDFGGEDFYVYSSGFNHVSGAVRITQNINPFHREISSHSDSAGILWDRFLNLKQIGPIDSILDYNELEFSQLAEDNYQFQYSPVESYIVYNRFSGVPYVPLLVEHYNAMVEKVNRCKYARPLSADQWYKERFRLQIDQVPTFQFSTGYIYSPFKFINQGYNYDNDQNGTNGTYSAYPCNVPFDAYGILNRIDKRVEWGNFDINIPYDIQDWFDLNVGIDFKPSNYGAAYTEVVSGASGYSYYVGYNFISGIDGNQYLSPDYSIGYSNYLKNGNIEPNPNPVLFDPQNFSGYHYLTIDSVNSFFTGIGQHFYWKNSFQPLAWESIKTYTGDYFTRPDNFIATGLYNNLTEPIIFGTGDGTALLGTDGTIFPILETWLSPSSENPSFRTNRNLHDSAYNTASVSYAPNEEKRSRILTTLSGNNNFYYGFVSGDPDSEVSGQYGSATYPLNDSVKRLWNLNWELNNTGDNRFYQLLPLGLSLFSNNENQLKWRLIGFKERFERLDQDFTFSSIENYSGKVYQTENYNSTEVFKIDAVGANTWSGCHTYIGEEYGPHIILEMHEPVIEL